MATHRLHLNPLSYTYIQSGQKTVENRLFDEKRSSYKVGDNLIFINNENKAELIQATITHLYRESSFRDLFLNKHTLGKYSTKSLEALLAGTTLHYSKSQEKEFGVVGIEFKINPRNSYNFAHYAPQDEFK